MAPSNGGLSMFPVLGNGAACSERGRLIRQSYLPRLAGLLNRQLSSTPLGDHSGPSSPPCWHGASKVTRAVKAFLRSIGTCWSLRGTHSRTLLIRQVYLGRFNEVWPRRFPAPPFVPFSYVLSSHSVLSLARTSVRPLACMRATTFNPGFRSPKS